MLLRSTGPVCCTALVLCLAIARAAAEPPSSATTPAEATADKPADASAPPLADPFFLLIQDETVRQALQLSDTERAAIEALLLPHNWLLLAMRDVGPQGTPAKYQPTLQQLREAVRKSLSAPQRARLAGLVLQAQGYDALLGDELATTLRLRPAQRQQLREAAVAFGAELKELNQTGDDRSAEDRRQALTTARQKLHQGVLAVLDEKQKKTWSQLLGEPFDFNKRRSSPARAPEFAGTGAWFNSEPLTLESLRGRVVVVHFFAFGCINCIHNYPWYREWYNELPREQVTIIGIHTPETEAEFDVGSLEKKLGENDLEFPVVVDNDKKSWQGWSNSMWPSVYLIDKQGRVRYWWYGELDWQGAGGQKLARQRIDELLAE